MTFRQGVPDPDRDMSPVSPSEVPSIFEHSDSAEDEEDAEGPENDGYQPITQEDDEHDAPEDEDDVSGLSMEEQVAALVRPGQSVRTNLSSETQDIFEKAAEERRQEEARAAAKVWQAAPREDSIEMSEAKIETIKSLMSGLSLPVSVQQCTMRK